jgi:phosphoglycolate phosphatase
LPDRPIAIDLDGTILDAEPRQVGVAYAVVLELTGRELDRPAFWRLKRQGRTTRDALNALGFDEEDLERTVRAWSEAVERSEWLALDQPLPGAARVLERLRDEGRDPVILTARRNAEGAREAFERLGLPRPAQLLVVSPNNAAEEKASALLAVGATCFVGDSESDAQAAAAARVPFAGVSTGQRDASFLESRGVEVFPSLSEALSALRATPSSKAGAPGSHRASTPGRGHA